MENEFNAGAALADASRLPLPALAVTAVAPLPYHPGEQVYSTAQVAVMDGVRPAPQPAGYIDRKDVARLSNCRATIWPGTNEIDAVPVFLAPPDVIAELAAARKEAQSHERLFLAACGDLGAVSEALGLNPDDGGAEPIIAAIKALQAGVPAGWKAVPIEPTEDMVIDGFESVPDRGFDGDDYPEEYDAMSGCQQAAFRAKRCWAAMLEAAPAAGNDL